MEHVTLTMMPIDQMSIAAGIIARIKNLKEVLCRMRVWYTIGLWVWSINTRTLQS